jgi:hypothetical protein
MLVRANNTGRADGEVIRFRATVELGGKTATGIPVPPDVVAGLGTSKRPAVVVRINDYTYRSTVAPRNGAFMLPLSAEHRAGAGIAAGDIVDVELHVDSEPRTVDIPADFSAALIADPIAKAFFGSLSYGNQRRHILAIEAAKAPETRRRRVEQSLGLFRSGRS